MTGAPRRPVRNRVLGSIRRDSRSLSWGFFPLTWPVAANAAMAAALVVQEAGGRVTAVDGSPWQPYGGNVLASNGHVHDAMVGVIRDHHARRRL